MASSTSRTIRANIFFAEKDLALREDVHKLGELVGELVREQGGEALYDLVEAARRASIAHREGDSDAYAELKALLGALAPTTAREFIRAFSTYFQMVNMAEKVHRIRRRRAYLRDENTPQPFGFIDILRRLKAEGASADEVERVIDTICIEPVFTAHPTEVTRRTLLRKQQSIARHLVEMMDPYMTPQELEATLGQIRMEMTTGWQTSEYPMEGIRLRDEAEHVLFFLTDVLYRMIPPFYESLEGALTATFPEFGGRIRVPPVLRFCSWVGGDMDGNPNVTAKSIRETLGRQRALVLDLYYQECQELARHLSQDLSRIGVSEELMQQSRLYAGHFPEAASSCRRGIDRCRIAASYGSSARVFRQRTTMRRFLTSPRRSSSPISSSSQRACARTRALMRDCSSCSGCCAARRRSASTSRRSTSGRTRSCIGA